jgi:hypothetical protein
MSPETTEPHPRQKASASPKALQTPHLILKQEESRTVTTTRELDTLAIGKREEIAASPALVVLVDRLSAAAVVDASAIGDSLEGAHAAVAIKFCWCEART